MPGGDPRNQPLGVAEHGGASAAYVEYANASLSTGRGEPPRRVVSVGGPTPREPCVPRRLPYPDSKKRCRSERECATHMNSLS